jgi:hypothetical protein
MDEVQAGRRNEHGLAALSEVAEMPDPRCHLSRQYSLSSVASLRTAEAFNTKEMLLEPVRNG